MLNTDDSRDTHPLPGERRRSMEELARQVEQLTIAVAALRKEQDEDREQIRLLLMLWGIDPRDPASVAKAYGARLKIVDAGKILLIVTGGGAAALILAAVNWLPSLWKSLRP